LAQALVVTSDCAPAPSWCPPRFRQCPGSLVLAFSLATLPAGRRLDAAMLRIGKVYCGGEEGQFRANDENIGWRRADGGLTRVYPVGAVGAAEWLEGELRVLCRAEDGSNQIFALEGFAPADFDKLWRHFEQHSQVYIKKVRHVAAVSEEAYDNAMRGLERGADQVDECPSGSVQKKAREADLMKKVENVRDGLEEAVRGDKVALSKVFAANGCERIGRLRLVIDTVQLEVYRRDERWVHLRNIAHAVEGVLRDLGAFKLWRPANDSDDTSMARRQMVWELRKRHGDDSDGSLPLLGTFEENGHDSTCVDAESAAGVHGRRPVAYDSTVPPPHLGPTPPGFGVPQDEPVVAGSRLVGSMEGAIVSNASFGDAGELDGNVGRFGGLDRPIGDTDNSGGAHEYVDEEVTNPNDLSAAPPGEAGGGRDGLRVRYTRPDSLLEGWVWKQSRHLKRWRRRWMILTPRRLESVKQRGDAKSTETVEAGTVQHVYSADADVRQSRCFCVVGPRNRNFYMITDDEDQKAEWMRQISSTLLPNVRS